MNNEKLISRYLDGELGTEEAELLFERIESDPSLERKLRSFERILAEVGRESPPPEGFTDRVMAEVRGAALADKNRRLSWPLRVAIAASIAIVFGLGWISGRSGPPRDMASGMDSPVAMRLAAPGVTLAGFTGSGEGMHLVRLVYLPCGEDVQQVAVAGSFNGWNPDNSPMRQEGGAWVAMIPLPTAVHEYMFVVDGASWVADPLAAQQRNDGFGNTNSVIDLTL